MFLLFCYFMFIRFRKTKKLYWFYFSLFFLFLLVSRALFIVYDYYMKIWILEIEYLGSNLPIVIYRLASFTGWLAAAMVVGILATLLFTKERKLHRSMAFILPGVVIIIATLILWLPSRYIIDASYYTDVLKIDVPVDIVPAPFIEGKAAGLFYLNYILLPILNFLLPCIFFYLAAKSVGVIRKSSTLNGLGLIIYYIGRSVQPFLKNIGIPLIEAFVPAIIILIGLLLMALANFILQS